jgi:hypothetical protein
MDESLAERFQLIDISFIFAIFFNSAFFTPYNDFIWRLISRYYSPNLDEFLAIYENVDENDPIVIEFLAILCLIMVLTILFMYLVLTGKLRGVLLYTILDTIVLTYLLKIMNGEFGLTFIVIFVVLFEIAFEFINFHWVQD